MLKDSWTAFEIGFAGVIATLILCFMVATPVCTLGLPWLPDITGDGIVSARPSDLLISINRNGIAWIADGDQPIDELANVLATRRYRRVIIEADRKVKFGALTPVFRAAQLHRVPVVFVGPSESALTAASRLQNRESSGSASRNSSPPRAARS